MTTFFISLYNYFQSHKILLYTSLVGCLGVCLYFASMVRLEENITRFFPDTDNAPYISTVFDNLKVKDKIVVMFYWDEKEEQKDQNKLIEVAGKLRDNLQNSQGSELIEDIFLNVDETLFSDVTNHIYSNLPFLLTEDDYLRLDTILTPDGIEQIMRKNYQNLLSPAGIALKEHILRDPLGVGNEALKLLQDFQLEANYEIYDECVFSQDGSTLFMFITPLFSTGSTGKNDLLITSIEDGINEINSENDGIVIEYYGGPAVGVYNARQIKKDTYVTSAIALIIIIVFISLVFKRKRSIPLILAPVVFGMLFSLACIYFIKGSISAIAIGAGSVVFGIALSYSIHMLAHQNHVSSIQQLIRELVYPLTVGSFTTIGAFLGLLFTSSELLRDFGIFSSFTLIGTTLFSLIYLPHFLKGQADVKQGRILNFIEKINAYQFDRNKWLISGIVILFIISVFAAGRVGFDEDMMKLNYEPTHILKAENRLQELFGTQEKTVLFVTVGKDADEAAINYISTNERLASLREKGDIIGYASAEKFILPSAQREAQLARWNNYWSAQKKEEVYRQVVETGKAYRFKENSFNAFYQWLNADYAVDAHLQESENDTSFRLLNDWHTVTDSLTMLITQVRLDDSIKEDVYSNFSDDRHVVIFDKAYFTNKWVSAVNDDFYIILYISSFLIFFALLISYGRIEITLMSFLPMFISWIIIVGLMGILGIQFNIINIILSTFIFGIGDDFSIFIMDGLQNKYRTGQKVLNHHKTAIFCSAFTIIVGVGVLVFAKHPALQSISLVSILGMVSVVLVAYTLQPFIFRIFISGPASKGFPPYTMAGFLRTLFFYLFFLIGCILLRLLIAFMHLLPIKKEKKKSFVCRFVRYSCRLLLIGAFFVRKETVNQAKEDFKKPAVIIANHQSFIDILVILSLAPKVIMMTNEWVWRSPFFGAIIRYIDFFYIGEGYDSCEPFMKKKISEGYSIAIFPEGTRTYDGKMKRFHKGAFYLSESLQLDIIPMLFYGNEKVIPKKQPFNIRKGIIYTKILSRIPYNDPAYGTTYQERTKKIARMMKGEYALMCLEKNNTEHPGFREALIQNYIYKGPVEEWYMRIKLKMEHYYSEFNSLVPLQGKIVDIGCGYGSLSYMLSMISDQRQIVGIDYDDEKIAVAQHSWLKSGNVNFVQTDALAYTFQESDVFILSDMLHYMSYEKQQTLLNKCVEKLLPGGMIVIREGNQAEQRKHQLTRFTELLSTRIVRFNKTIEELCFTSEGDMNRFAREAGLEFELVRNNKYTSNTIYILRKAEK